MTCKPCDGRAHTLGTPCPECYGTGEQDAAPVAPALIGARLAMRSEAWAQYDTPSFHREAAFCRLAQVITLGRARVERSTLNRAAHRGTQFAIISGIDVQAYVVALLPWLDERGCHLVLAEVAAGCDILIEREIRRATAHA